MYFTLGVIWDLLDKISDNFTQLKSIDHYIEEDQKNKSSTCIASYVTFYKWQIIHFALRIIQVLITLYVIWYFQLSGLRAIIIGGLFHIILKFQERMLNAALTSPNTNFKEIAPEHLETTKKLTSPQSPAQIWSPFLINVAIVFFCYLIKGDNAHQNSRIEDYLIRLFQRFFEMEDPKQPAEPKDSDSDSYKTLVNLKKRKNSNSFAKPIEPKNSDLDHNSDNFPEKDS